MISVDWGGNHNAFHVASNGDLVQGWYTDTPSVGALHNVLLTGNDKYAQAFAWVGGNGWLNVVCAATDGSSRRIFFDGSNWRDAYGNIL